MTERDLDRLRRLAIGGDIRAAEALIRRCQRGEGGTKIRVELVSVALNMKRRWNTVLQAARPQKHVWCPECKGDPVTEHSSTVQAVCELCGGLAKITPQEMDAWRRKQEQDEE